MSIFKTSILIVFIAVLSSCASKQDDKTAWDETANCLEIKDAGLNYTPPTDIKHWIIADNENLIPQIKFCGVDTVTRICITIVNPPIGIKEIAEMDSDAVSKSVREITCQYPAESIIKYDTKIEKSLYRGAESWKFISDISVREQFDTIRISNRGYFFDNGNKIYGIVATIPGLVADKMSDADIEIYLSGVK